MISITKEFQEKLHHYDHLQCWLIKSAHNMTRDEFFIEFNNINLKKLEPKWKYPY